jgi:hypothetical protein
MSALYRSAVAVLNNVDGFRREFDLADPQYVPSY